MISFVGSGKVTTFVATHDKDSFLFQRKARLEVSGILKGNDSMLRNRHAAKVEQTRKSDSMHLPAYVSVIEFSQPKAVFTKR